MLLPTKKYENEQDFLFDPEFAGRSRLGYYPDIDDPGHYHFKVIKACTYDEYYDIEQSLQEDGCCEYIPTIGGIIPVNMDVSVADLSRFGYTLEDFIPLPQLSYQGFALLSSGVLRGAHITQEDPKPFPLPEIDFSDNNYQVDYQKSVAAGPSGAFEFIEILCVSKYKIVPECRKLEVGERLAQTIARYGMSLVFQGWTMGIITPVIVSLDAVRKLGYTIQDLVPFVTLSLNKSINVGARELYMVPTTTEYIKNTAKSSPPWEV